MGYNPPPAASAGAAQANAEAYTDAQIANLKGGVIPRLSTLKELADAIGDDPAYAVNNQVVPAAPYPQNWKPAAPISADLRATAVAFPAAWAQGNHDIYFNDPGEPRIVRISYTLSLPANFTGMTCKIFTGANTYVWTVQANPDNGAEADFTDVIEVPVVGGGQSIIQFQVGALGITLVAFSVTQVATQRRYVKLSAAGATPGFGGGSTMLIQAPIEPTVGNTKRRVAYSWAGTNGADDATTLRPAYAGHVVYPEAAYFEFHTERVNLGGRQFTVGNNDFVMDIYTAPAPSAAEEFRGDVHGGETSRTDAPALDTTVQYDTLGDGTWRTYIVGRGFREAARVRVTQRTKLKMSSGTLVAYLNKVYTIYADGTLRQDRTITFQNDTRLKDFYVWMTSGDPAQHPRLIAMNRKIRSADKANADAVTAINFYDANYGIMVDPGGDTGVCYAIGVDRPSLLANPLTTPGSSTTSPPPGPRTEDGQINGNLNKIYLFLRFKQEIIPAGWSITSTQWASFYFPTDPNYPERDQDTRLATPERMTLTYPPN